MTGERAAAERDLAAALEHIRRIPDAQERIEAAGELPAGFAREADEIRRAAVIEIYEAGKYSLKGLADSQGKSKQWAAQIIPADHPQRQERRTRKDGQ